MIAELSVLEAKRYGVLSCQKEQTLSEAARLMVDEDVSALVVVDETGSLEGIISRMDMMRALLHEPDWAHRPVAEYMNRNVVTVSIDSSLKEVARILLESQIHRVVVIREQNGCVWPVSVISAADIIYHMTQVD